MGGYSDMTDKCSQCGGNTIKFRFTGKERQYWICPRWKEPGHLNEDEMRAKYVKDAKKHAPPSGRFA